MRGAVNILRTLWAGRSIEESAAGPRRTRALAMPASPRAVPARGGAAYCASALIGTARAAVTVVAVALIGTEAGTPAWATEGSEIFARGFGSKAAAMGNSFVSIADDASAVFWNPAGTGWIAKNTLTVSLTDAYFSDVDYSSVAYVHPLSHMGAVGFSLSRWSVGDIEKRDEKNVLIRDDLTDSQMEMIASFSTPPLRNMTAAVGFKVDTQTLDDEEALGVGLDLGLLYRCGASPGLGRPCLSAGVNIRNLIEPVLKMRVDRTTFPTRAILSASYSGGRSRYLDNWTMAFDLNARSEIPAYANFGLEAMIRPVNLRLGSQDGRLTAGFGTFWESLSFDYAYTDEDFGRLHTFSLTLSFGTPFSALGAAQDETMTEPEPK